MLCHFVDDRVEFFALLQEKLGEGFSLEPSDPKDHDKVAACDVVICNLPAAEDPRFSVNLKILQKLVRNPEGVPVVAFLSTGEREIIRAAHSAGAYDHFVESGSMEELRLVLRRAAQFQELRRELHRLRTNVSSTSHFFGMIGTDAQMRSVFELASKVASTNATVLITGESGTGKELLARAIHHAGPRDKQPFVAVACSSLPETLIETGHVYVARPPLFKFCADQLGLRQHGSRPDAVGHQIGRNMRTFAGALSVGFRPTFGSNALTVEVFILDFDGATRRFQLPSISREHIIITVSTNAPTPGDGLVVTAHP